MHDIIKRYKDGERDFRVADLRGADLRGADLSWINLCRAYMVGSDLSGANLSYADLGWTNLRSADLRGANLRGAHMRGIDLRGADLRGADLLGAGLYFIDAHSAKLDGTVLDPSNVPNGGCTGFEKIRCRNNTEWCVGYRSKTSMFVGNTVYEVGSEYTAQLFSTSDDECHPGLYVCSSHEGAKFWSDGGLIVQVIFRPEDCHRAVDKWRVKSFIVMEDLQWL